MNVSAAQGHRRCENCRANLPRHMTRCWLCGAELGRASNGEIPYELPQPIDELNQRGFSLATLLLFITLFAVLCGVCTFAPGVGIPLAIFVGISFLSSTVVVYFRASRGKQTSWLHRLGVAAVSFMFLFSASALIVVVVYVAMFISCLKSFSTGV